MVELNSSVTAGLDHNASCVIVGQLQAKTSLSVPQEASLSQDFPGGSEVGT